VIIVVDLLKPLRAVYRQRRFRQPLPGFRVVDEPAAGAAATPPPLAGSAATAAATR
jgi:hypothetical protein